MLKRLRAKHPVGFCVLSEVLFLGSLLLASYLIVFALVLFGVDLERVDSYFLSAVQEAVGMVVALVILGRTGKMYLLRRRGSGFFNGRTITTVDAVHFRCRHLDHSADRHVIRVRYDSSIIFIQIYPKQFASVIFQRDQRQAASRLDLDTGNDFRRNGFGFNFRIFHRCFCLLYTSPSPRDRG